jgi:hypothetical protein
MDGQRECEVTESEHRENDENSPVPIPPVEPSLATLDLNLIDSGNSLSASPSSWLVAGPSSPEMLPAHFSALSITPHTPTRRRHSRESSASSVDSLPESPLFSGESLNFGLADFDLPFEDAGSPPALPSLPFRRLRPNPFTFDLFSALSNPRNDVGGTAMDGLDFSLN